MSGVTFAEMLGNTQKVNRFMTGLMRKPIGSVG